MKGLIAAMAVGAAILMSVDVRSPYEKIVPSTVWVRAGDGNATGVFIGKNRVLTAAHVVEGKPEIRIHISRRVGDTVVSDPEKYSGGLACVVIASDPEKDLALLRVEGNSAPMDLAWHDPAPGDPLYSVGCGEGTALFGFASGHVRQVSLMEYPRASGADSGGVVMFCGDVIDMTLPVNFGDSGSAVCDSRGKMVGLIIGMDAMKNQTYLAITITEIRSFLARAEKQWTR